MAIRDADFGAALTLAEGDDGIRSPCDAAPGCAARNVRSLYERERARAEAAEARCEELRRAELGSRSRAGSLKWQLDASRNKLKAAVEETREVRRTARNALSLQAEVARLGTLLSEAGVEPGKRSTIVSLRMEVARLRKAAPSSAARSGPAPRRSRNPEQTIAPLREENTRLKKEVRAAKGLERRIGFLDGEIDTLHSSLRASHAHKERIVARHHLDRRRAAAVRMVEARERRIVGLRARNDRLRAATVRATDMIVSLREKNAGLRAEVRASEAGRKTLASRAEALEAALAKLRATRAVLSKSLFGRKSERRQKPRSGRRRGQQPGAAGHGRTPRPNLDERTEERNPPKDARVCSCCGKPRVANGERSTTIVEIEVRAHTRKIVRPRWRRTCDCPSSPMEVCAPPAPRLFDNTPYGIGVWTCVLFERFVCRRPLHRVSTWLADHGLPVSPGTLADSVRRFVPLFEPVAQAILAHQNQAALRHADETTWRVQALREKGRSSRAWLWTSVSDDALCFHIDPSRSAEVAKTLFGATVCNLLLVCDRLSTCKRLARELGGKVILCWCWAHQRRTFIECAAGHVRLTRWCRGWIERIAALYRLNEARLAHYDPGLEHRTPAFDAAQGALEVAVGRLFEDAEEALAGLSAKARRAGPLRSLLNHREGLSVFVGKPRVPLDNNRAELALRGAVTGRRLSFGSDSEDGARFTAMMDSVVGTLASNGLDVRRWVQAWLTACTANGGQPPDDLSPWLPWSMSEERRRELVAPG